MLPFTSDEFLQVFTIYNQAIWPLQLVGYGLGVAALVLALWPVRYAGQIVSAILALFWLWMGAVYHIAYFAVINSAAYGFGALFFIQGVLLFVAGTLRRRLAFRCRFDGYTLVGLLGVAYAMLIYPLLGAALGHGYPMAPIFGVAPCPTTIFTFALLLLTQGPVPPYLLIIPVIWTLIGGTAAWLLAMPEDFGLLAMGLVGTALILVRNYRDRHSSTKQG